MASKLKKLIVIIVTMIFTINVVGILTFASTDISTNAKVKLIATATNAALDGGEVNAIDNGAGNVTNSGCVCNADDGYIYYCNVNDNGKLYRIKKDGSDKQKISDDVSTNVNVVKGYLYYRNHSDGGKIYRINTDGGNKTVINADNSFNITIVDSMIYYINADGDNIYSVKLDGTNRKKLSDDKTLIFNVSNGYIYYIASMSYTSKIYKMEYNGENKVKLCDDYAAELCVVDRYIYYINTNDHNRIYCIQNDGTNREKLVDDFAKNINVFGEYVYYKNFSDKSNIYRAKIDGTSKQKIVNFNKADDTLNINISSEWIYYQTFQKSYTVRTFNRAKLDGTNYENLGEPSNINFDTIKKSANNNATDTTVNPSTNNAGSAQQYLILAQQYDMKVDSVQSEVKFAYNHLQDAINLNTGVSGAQRMYDQLCSLLQTYKNLAAKYHQMAQNAK